MKSNFFFSFGLSADTRTQMEARFPKVLDKHIAVHDDAIRDHKHRRADEKLENLPREF